MKRILMICPLLFWTTFAQGELYTWTDPKGTAHYTNSIDDVPLRYRARMKVLTYDTGQKDTTVPPSGQIPVKPVMPLAERKNDAGVVQADPVQPAPTADQERHRKKRLERKRERGNALEQ